VRGKFTKHGIDRFGCGQSYHLVAVNDFHYWNNGIAQVQYTLTPKNGPLCSTACSVKSVVQIGAEFDVRSTLFYIYHYLVTRLEN